MSEENQITEKFVNSIKKWVELDDKMAKIKNDLKELNHQKKDFEVVILEEFEKLDTPVIAITNGKLRRNVSKTQTPIKKDLIQKALLEYLKDETKTKEIIENMMKSRPFTERINLKRTKNKEPETKPNT
jgi:hypothetical protein